MIDEKNNRKKLFAQENFYNSPNKKKSKDKT